jgi:ATP-dependent DNA helicase RecQ
MDREKENARAGDLQEGVVALRGEEGDSIWWQLIDGFMEAYRDETADSLLPVSRAIDRLYEFVAEQRREKVVGQGIFLSTIHAAKGMEFPHVFLLDGDWRQPGNSTRWEEERRIFYVGMTRARETLHLLRIPGRSNPFLKEIGGNCVMPVTWRGTVGRGDHPEKNYELLGLNEIYLDYAGMFPQTHPIHCRLAGLGAGQRVALRRNGSRVDIVDGSGSGVGRLSGEGAHRWLERLDHILEVRVVAVLRRFRDDPDERFSRRIRVDSWELPVLEVVYRNRRH